MLLANGEEEHEGRVCEQGYEGEARDRQDHEFEAGNLWGDVEYCQPDKLDVS